MDNVAQGIKRPDNPRDEDERKAYDLERKQHARWLAAGSQISFFQRDEEIAILHRIRGLKKMSASYQRRYGYPPTGIAEKD